MLLLHNKVLLVEDMVLKVKDCVVKANQIRAWTATKPIRAILAGLVLGGKLLGRLSTLQE